MYGVGFFVAGKITNKNATLQTVAQVENSQDGRKLERPQPEEKIQSVTVLAATVKRCSNNQYLYQVSYPREWFTTYNTPEDECSFFAPYSFVLPPKPNTELVPITIKKEDPQNWEQTLKLYENPNDFQNVVASTNIEINGKAVKKVEAMATGGGINQKGYVKISFLVFDATTPLIFTYQQSTPNENVIDNISVLEEMVKTLKYF